MISELDIGILLAYIILMLVIGIFVGRKENIEDFLVNRRKTKTFFLAFTVISTNVGAGTIAAISAASYSSGISYPLIAGLGVCLGFLLVALLSPRIKGFGDKYNAHTLSDFFGIRYSLSNRILTGLILLVSYFFWTALQFVALAFLLKVITGFGFNLCLILSSVVVIAYTSIAGIKSDFYTDVVQFWVLTITLFCILLPLGLIKIGGFTALASLPSEYFSPFTFAGPGFFFLFLIFGSFLGLASMEIWQRVYAATSPKTAKKTFIAASFINMFMVFFAGLIGMIAFLLFKDIDPNFALFKTVTSLLPRGILGLGLAGVFAALMSTVDSMIMVGSATLLKDFCWTFKKELPEKKVLKYGRLFTLLYGAIALITSYAIPNLIKLQLFGIFTLLVFVPAIVGGFFWKRADSKGAFLSILLGFIVTMVGTHFIPKIAFIPGVLTSLVVFIVVSLLTTHSKTEKFDL
jgi:SSS family solute:Na+ symporter